MNLAISISSEKLKDITKHTPFLDFCELILKSAGDTLLVQGDEAERIFNEAVVGYARDKLSPVVKDEASLTDAKIVYEPIHSASPFIRSNISFDVNVVFEVEGSNISLDKNADKFKGLTLSAICFY